MKSYSHYKIPNTPEVSRAGKKRAAAYLIHLFTMAAVAVILVKPTAAAAQDSAPQLIWEGQVVSPRGGTQRKPTSIITTDMLSPKSVNFSLDGTRIYINALEGFATLVYSFPDLKRVGTIRHRFTKADSALFKDGETTIFDYKYFRRSPGGHSNIFSGKPVEAVFSHNGKYLWVPYYRRDFDTNSSCPSAIAIIDTEDDNRIVRVMPTGPLPKVVAASPDGKWLAVTHWGDNTVGLIDITSSDPFDFTYARHLIVGHKLNVENITGNRDANCGFCLRGTLFTPDSRYLLVSRLGGGGITVFDLEEEKTLGSFEAFSYSPRHIVMDREGTMLYASNPRAGTVTRVSLKEVFDALATANGRSIAGPKGQAVSVGVGARTIDISPDGRFLYAAVNNSSELVQVDLTAWRVVNRAPVSPFAVGLGVSPDGKHVVVTSQGKSNQGGGNSIEVFRTSK